LVASNIEKYRSSGARLEIGKEDYSRISVSVGYKVFNLLVRYLLKHFNPYKRDDGRG
jgi:hypothetical protein